MRIRSASAALALLAAAGCSAADTAPAERGIATYWSIGQPTEVFVTIGGFLKTVDGPFRYDSSPDMEYKTTGPATKGVKLWMIVRSVHDEPYGGVIECRIEAFGIAAAASGRTGECLVELTP